MALLELVDVEFNYSDKELYRKINLKLNDAEHAVLVGVNGSGKTTILNLLAGKFKPDSGKVIWTPHVTYSYLDQNLEVKEDIVAKDYLDSVYASLFHKEKEMERYYELAASDIANFEKHIQKATAIQDDLIANDFYSLKERVAKLVDGLGISKDRLEMPLNKLSSGQREKIYLARMLLEQKDVLLMDEPTNFLDASQVEWLADYLNTYPRAFLLVSHDQDFLNKVANVVFSLENKTLVRYRGSFSHFLEQHALDKEMYEKNYNAQQRYIKKEEDFIAKHIVRATSSRAAKSHRARLAHLERMEAPGKEEGKVRFFFPFSHDVGQKVLEVTNLAIGYENKQVLDNISFLIKKNEKVAILGRNGVGKTTLIKTILNRIPPIEGSYRFLDGIKVNYYEQEAKIDLSLSPFEYMHKQYPNLDNTKIRTVLGSFGIKKELAIRPMNELSGGEVAKTKLAIMSQIKANFLIFDEPTNHLDQKAKDALFEAIERFEGSVILISHEKDFYDGLVDYEIHF